MEKPDFIEVYDNVFSKDFCEKVIHIFDAAHENKLTLNRQEHDGARQLDKTDNALFFPSYPLDSMPKGIFGEFSDIFWSVIYPQYESKYGSIKHLDKHANYTIKVQKTEPSEGYHIWHCETADRVTASRVLAWTVYLNDNFDAGETEFLYQQKRIIPKQGSALIFPTGFTHVHRGNPPMNGTKYIITGWCEF